jgi:hypothetical protein
MLDKKFLGETHINMILEMTEQEASEHLEKVGKKLRVINRDNRGLMVTMDIDPNRVNVFVKNGKVSHLDTIG